MGYKITFAQLGPTIERKIREIHGAAERATMDAALFGQAASVKATDDARVTDTGVLKRSWKSRATGDGAEIRNDAPYAAAIEAGSRPHTPPLEPILAWVRRKLGKSTYAGIKLSYPKGTWKKNAEAETYRIARAIQQKIAREGTKPHFLAKNLLPDILDELKKECERIIAEVARKP